MDNVSAWVALAGGIVSLVSPCTLPMIPVYFATLAGPETIPSSRRKFQIFLRSLSFVIGFSVVFVLLGSGVGLIGFSVKTHLVLVRYIAGGLMVLFGLFMLASTRFSWLNFEKHLAVTQGVGSGHWRALVIGALFGLAWTPCAGPVLGSILTLAFQSRSGWQGAYLLSFYSLGMALPFLLFGLGLDYLSPWLKRMNRYSIYIYILSGLLLIALGGLLISNHLNWFSF
jgi:cytochrome c-type biogenesis protein